MIHDELVSYGVAKLAKEKGFNEGCLFYYQNGVTESDGCYNHYNMGNKNICSAPTQSLLQRWLREEKRVVFDISPMHEIGCDYLAWCVTIYKLDKDGYGLSWQEELYYDTYELALDDALKYALENLV